MLFKDDEQLVHVISYDEKPGIQAIAITSDDLYPDEKHRTFSRDYEYKRLGTVSLLAGIDLQTGEAIPLVRDTHNSKDCIEFLKLLDAKYPKKIKFGWFLIISRCILQMKLGNILRPFQDDLNLYSRLNTVHG